MSQRTSEKKGIRRRAVTRRSFIGAGAAAALACGLSACAPASNQGKDAVVAQGQDASDVRPADAPAPTAAEFGIPEQEGTWVTCDCWDNCGGGCVNKVLVVDGKPVRQKTDDTHEDSFDWPQQRSCPRGHSRRNQVMAEDRLKYPMKRAHWEPLTGGDKSLRGKDAWERISWDEALDYVAAELSHVVETYGNRAILCTHRPDGRKQQIMGVLSALGDYVQELDSHSYGTFGYNMAAIGIGNMGSVGGIDRYTLQSCENIVLYGVNTVWSAAGNPALWLQEAKAKGAQFVSVAPDYNVTAALLDARWIPVRPGTDTAFLLAVIYCMLKNDEAAPDSVIDWDFMSTYTVGFTADNMPDDAVLDENLKDYVLGAYDDTPKTPEWASRICGTPVEDIEWYAQLMGKQNSVGLFYSFGPARCNGAEGFPQLFHTVGALGGHMGRVGHACVNCNEASAFNGGPSAVKTPSAANPAVPNPLDEWIAAPYLWDAVVDGHYTYTGNYLYGMGGVTKPAEERDLDIHAIVHTHQAAIGTAPNIMKAIEAHRKVDFVLSANLFFTPNCQYADIVLPICTPWESWQPGACTPTTNCDTKIFPQKVMDPIFESKNDIWVARELAGRLGLDADAIAPKSAEQLFFDYTAGATVKDAEGNDVPLATLTQADIDKWSDELGITWENGPQEGVMSFDELLEAGVYTRKRSVDDSIVQLGWKAFVDDPVADPLKSASGKLEVYCQVYADECNMQGRSTIKPYPTYFKAPGTYEDSFEDFEAGKQGEYRFQVYTPHYLRRAHSVMDNSPWMREAFENPVFMNASDAEKLGVELGDTVRLYNQRGSILRNVVPTETFMPGVLGVPHGAWPDVHEDGIDYGGAENVLIGGPSTGWGVSGYNTTLVAVEKFGAQLEADCDMPARSYGL